MALVIAVGDIQALVQAAFDAPAARLDSNHWAALPGDLLDAGQVHRLGAAGAGTQVARFGLTFVELTARAFRSRVEGLAAFRLPHWRKRSAPWRPGSK